MNPASGIGERFPREPVNRSSRREEAPLCFAPDYGKSLLTSAATRRVSKLVGIGGLAAAGVAALVLFLFDPARCALYPVCMFHQMTGLDCPGCGSLRALHQLLHGHFGSALHFNALAVLSLPFFGWLIFRFVRHRMKGDAFVVRPRWLWLYLAAWVGFGALRVLPLPFLAGFAP